MCVFACVELDCNNANGADNLVQGWWIGIVIDWLIMQPVFWLAWSLIQLTGLLLRNIHIAPRVIYGEFRSLFTRGKHRAGDDLAQSNFVSFVG